MLPVASLHGGNATRDYEVIKIHSDSTYIKEIVQSPRMFIFVSYV